MRGLFQVFVVDIKEGQCVDSPFIVAKDEGNAQIKALAKISLTKDLDEYCIIVDRIGDVPEKKGIQEVKIVTEN